MQRRLYRSRSDRMIWGVCGGLAEYFDWDPTIVRIIAILLIFAEGLGLLAYVIMAIVVPQEGSKSTEPGETIKENVEEMKETASELGREISSTFAEDREKSREDMKTQQANDRVKSEAMSKYRHRSLNAVGVILIVIGALFLISDFGLFSWLRWSTFWPLIVIAIGALIILGARRK